MLRRKQKNAEDDSCSDSEQKNKVSTKKNGKPGRPRKSPQKETIQKMGIQLTPLEADDFVEFLYDKPTSFKTIFQFLKNMAAVNVQILFRKSDIIFYAIDHYKKSRIYIRFDATKLNHYYQRDLLDIGVSSKEVQKIMNMADKEYVSIAIFSKLGHVQKSILFVLDNDIKIREENTVEIIAAYEKMDNESLFTDEDYTLKFDLQGKFFKKMITDIRTMSKEMSIIQDNIQSPLKFSYTIASQKIKSDRVVKDANKINLVSKLKNDDSFRVDIVLEYIRAISASQLSNRITIMVDEKKPLMTKAILDDGAIEIKVLTDIVGVSSFSR